jgi:hypothetical protein
MTTINNLPVLDLAGLSVEAVSIPVVNTTSTTPGATFQLPLSEIAMLAHGDPGYTGFTGSAGPAGNPGGYTGSAGLRGYTGSVVNLSTITQSITPSSSDIYDLGAGGRFWRGVYTAELYVNSGNIKDLNTGLPIQFNTANTGTVGPQGYSGSLGIIGYTGSASTATSGVGYAGSRGYTGSASTATGAIGYTGSAGLGYAGSRGYTGSASTATGAIGYTGSAGLGYAGSAGLGFTGSTGAMGYAGSAGTGGGISGVNVWDEDILVGTFANLNFVGASVVVSTQSTSSGGYAAITLSATTGTGGIGYTGSTGAAGYTGSLGLTTSTSALLISGLTTLQQTSEVIQALTGSTGTVTHDWSQGAIWYHTSVGSSFTVNFTNVPTTNNRSNVSTVIISQGATPYSVLAVQIAGAAQTVKWLGGSAPPTVANRTEAYTFDLLYVGSTWVVTGSLASYG